MNTVLMSFAICASLFAPVTAEDLRVAVAGTNGAVFRKVIIRANDAVIFEKPGGQGKSEPASAFKIYYLLKSKTGASETMVDGKVWLRLGTSGTKPVGWVAKAGRVKDDIIFWNTRSLLMPRIEALSKANPLIVYRDAANTEKRAELPGLSGTQVSICPILEPPADYNDPVYHITFFSAAVTSSDAPTMSESSVEDFGMEIVFVIDTTRSMSTMLDGLKDFAKSWKQQLAVGPFSAMQGRLRFGLVEYQDSTPGLFSSRVTIPLTADMDTFVVALNKISVATSASEETKEDVLAGLKTAITGKAAQGDQAVGWTSHSFKHIVLLGDASAHVEGPKNTTGLDIKRVIDLARATDGGSEIVRHLSTITLHAIRAINVEDPSDQDECERQFKAISRNNDRETGYYASVDPHNPQEIISTLDKFSGMISDCCELILPSIKDRQRTDDFARKAWELYDLTQSEDQDVVCTGFTTTVGPTGKAVADLRLLITFSELERLEHSLRFLYSSFAKFQDHPDDRNDLDNLLTAFQVLAAGIVIGDRVSVSKLPDVISQIPFRSALFEMTSGDLSRMTNEEYRQWLARIETSRKRINALMGQSNNWHQLVGDRARFVFLKVDELPF